MYNLAMISIVSLLWFQVPDPIPPPDPKITIPVGALPWSLPQLPIIDIDLGSGSADFDEVQHTDDYADNLAGLEYRVSVSSGVELSGDTEAEAWIGEDGLLPDMTTDDFVTGIDLPGYEDMTAYDVADAFGTNVGTLFSYVRALAGLSLNGFTLGGAFVVLGVLVLCIAWMILVHMIIFGINLLDMLWSVITTVIELIPFAE